MAEISPGGSGAVRCLQDLRYTREKLLEMRWGTLRVSSSFSVFEPQVLGLSIDYCAKNWKDGLTLICHQTHMMIHLNNPARTS
jgi:hypothetical protein